MNERQKTIGEHEILFREVNERIIELDAELGVGNGALRFVCECGRLECAETITMSLAEYRGIRSKSNQFVVVSGHEIEDIEDVVGRNDGYAIVRKYVLPPKPAAEQQLQS
jgi:hypothetical protein